MRKSAGGGRKLNGSSVKNEKRKQRIDLSKLKECNEIKRMQKGHLKICERCNRNGVLGEKENVVAKKSSIDVGKNGANVVNKIVKKESTLHEVIRGINVPKRNGEVKKVRTETAANGAANKNGKKQETVVQTEKHKQANKHRLLGEYKPYNHPARWRY